METHLSKTLETESDPAVVVTHEDFDQQTLDPNGSFPKTLDDNHHQSLVRYGPLPRDISTNHSLPLTDTEDDRNEDDSGNRDGDDYLRTFSLSRSSEKRSPTQIKPTGVGAGLENLGNTCFINAILQCVTHTLPFVQALRSLDHPKPCDGATEGFCIICALRDHIDLSLASSGKVVSPWKFVDNLNNISSFFERYQQEDAHEFLQCLLDKVERCCLDLRTKDESLLSQDNIVQRVFGGRLISKLRCCNCGNCSDTYEPLTDVSLEIEDVTSLESALESFTKLEKIEDPETKFTCEKCKEQVSVDKQLMLDNVPSIAAFHLKRFKTDGSYVVKIDKHVEFPLELDLKSYTSSGQNSDVELKYHLYAIVEHTGSLPTCGHYFSYIRSSPDTWHRLNDSRVTRVKQEFVLSQDAYILLYAREGTAWISNLLEAENLCLDADIYSSSPKSVLDNAASDYPAHSTMANAEKCNATETSDFVRDSSTSFSCELERSKDQEVSEAVQGMSACFNLESCKQDRRYGATIDDASRVFTDGGVHGKIEITDGFRPLTPRRSSSPDVYCDMPPETNLVQREPLKLEKKVAGKRQLEKDGKDIERQEAMRCIKKTMTGSRYMKLMAAVNDGPASKKRRLKTSPCKRTIPSRVHRKHDHGRTNCRVAI